MESSEHVVTVDVPASSAYDVWTRVETYPRFLEGVHDVRRLDEHRTRWVTAVDGVRRDYDAELLANAEEQRVSWWSVDGPRRAGVVSVVPVSEHSCEVTLRVEWAAGAGDASSAATVDGQVRHALERFRSMVENVVVLPNEERVVWLPAESELRAARH